MAPHYTVLNGRHHQSLGSGEDTQPVRHKVIYNLEAPKVNADKSRAFTLGF